MLTIAVNERGLRIGEDHQLARYLNSEIELLLSLRDEGKSYGEIVKIMGMPKSTVASVCNGKRRCQIAVAFKKIVMG